MHRIQQQLLQLAGQTNLGERTLRVVAKMIGEESPQKVKHHLNQLEKRGLIRVDRSRHLIERTEGGPVSGLLNKRQLLTLPLLGSANAGPATLYAEENIEGYLKISSTFVGRRANRKLFALRVSGPSMNRATIDNKRIEDGDYVIIDSEDRLPKHGDIVLSIIDGMANIKRFYLDKANRQIALAADSAFDFPPIYIHETDDFSINGKVIQIIKKPVKKS
ncbi:MAG TPA: S24 family peptidase [Pyrinomonadaceae bacterium]|nr:S24 family peptidase [Pyrinomonadaceae bacterium]